MRQTVKTRDLSTGDQLVSVADEHYYPPQPVTVTSVEVSTDGQRVSVWTDAKSLQFDSDIDAIVIRTKD